jgi:hypothetical protein
MDAIRKIVGTINTQKAALLQVAVHLQCTCSQGTMFPVAFYAMFL